MLPSPSSSPAQFSAFVNSTNLLRNVDESQDKCSHPWLQLPTPPTHTKRPLCEEDASPSKRARKTVREEAESSETEEIMMERARTRFRRRTCNALRMASNELPFQRPSNVSTRSILQSFVSSYKSDFFRCESVEHGFLTPPYACSYSHSAKAGRTPHLAVSTEEGAVHIFNTIKRSEWDPEPIRTTFQPHDNGVYDVKWSASDSRLATCSADRSIRISCPNTSKLLQILTGHGSSVKRAAWHSSNDSLLCSGGRDGTICIWDLRIPQSSTSVFNIPDAHESLALKGRRSKQHMPKTITNLIFNEDMSLISSGSSDGVLRCWDLRFVSASGRSLARSKRFIPSLCTPIDPTTSHGSHRPRGILSLTAGIGPSSGLLFALGADSRIHTYMASSLSPLPISFTDPNIQVNGSFYISSAISPCGRWLASGGGKSALLFDVSTAASPYARASSGVELKAQLGEVYAVDWADGMIATCADDRTVRIWRPDVDLYQSCLEDPNEYKWKWSWAMKY
ncbi:WD40-repeat-containing domain protein [Lentinula aciculospora]|uniref:WD40-repeat-containing domain protein n=1 Tax=Lentinula aciculospora TaxID=153920 RepID=A0A9W9A1W6_9AGAR|nr:WD40-repeat-containing domain protein [Lentinula aciculospora]